MGDALTQGDITLGVTTLAGGLTLSTTGRVHNRTAVGSNAVNATLGSDSNFRIQGGGAIGSGQVGAADNDLKIHLSGVGKLDVKTNNAPIYINLTHGGYLGQVNAGSAGIQLSAGNTAIGSHGSLLNGNGAAYNLVAGPTLL